MTEEQENAFVEGFFKRASEQGVDSSMAKAMLLKELEGQKANVPLNAIFGGGLPLYHGARDMMSPSEAPSRLANISLPAAGGMLSGSVLGMLTKNPTLGRTASQLAAHAGGGYGAHRYNEKLQAAIDKVKNGE